MDTKKRLTGYLCVIFAVFIWSGWMSINKLGTSGTLSPSDITAIRFATAGLLLLPLAIKKGLGIGPWGLKGGLLLSFLIGAFANNMVGFGMKFAPVSHASAIINGMPLVLTTILGMCGLGERVRGLRLAGVFFGIAGIAIMLISTDTHSDGQWIGHVFFVFAGLMWAIYTVLIRLWAVDALHAVTVVAVFSMIVYLPIYVLFFDHHLALANWHEILLQLIYQGVFNSIAALVSFNVGVTILGSTCASAFVPLIPVFATVLSIPLLGEKASVLEWGAIIAISAGVLLASGIVRGVSKV